METNNIDMEELMKMKEFIDMEKCEKDNEKEWDKHDKNSHCGKVNIFTKNVYLSINCHGRKW
ncbi:hypothetical protein C3B64_14385 [Clostridium botulinum]|uniref:Uncharacterized protein n=2 Tax=Clostridium TaxID=1485 RepID=A0AAU8YZW4_CLOBO|nr:MULTISPECIES: hypothetical protein [Clostridium]AVP62423.1 hypothetical protein C7M79_17740 [Clostridium botulinum]AKC61576.1 hypothetical protein CLSPO_c08550 [Clostridium sporogenes]AKJ88902.1 hypothetical protein CLSPOx_04310 [Clostridium sporogenes]AVP65378.1 hypothetical protein C3B64_14385 [Clostridium botulinum]KCZ68881.1 hypothetical protein CSPO_4c04060 [Clostridium sporogenes]